MDTNDGYLPLRAVMPQVLCSETQPITECQSLLRLIMALKFYDEHGQNEDMVLTYFDRYDHLLDDYTHILSVHFGQEKDIDDMVGALMYSKVRQFLKCDLKTCPYYYSRDLHHHPLIEEDASNECMERSHRGIFYQNMMAAIHCYLLHPFYSDFKMFRPGTFEQEPVSESLEDLSWDDDELSRLKQTYLATIRTADAHKMMDALHKRQRTRFSKFMIGTLP